MRQRDEQSGRLQRVSPGLHSVPNSELTEHQSLVEV